MFLIYLETETFSEFLSSSSGWRVETSVPIAARFAIRLCFGFLVGVNQQTYKVEFRRHPVERTYHGPETFSDS